MQLSYPFVKPSELCPKFVAIEIPDVLGLKQLNQIWIAHPRIPLENTI